MPLLPESSPPAAQAFPLCVDMDGTLLKTDSLIESMILLLKSNPLSIFLMAAWLLKGKACLKEELSSRVLPDIAHLPLRSNLVSRLKAERDAGRKLVLVTGAHLSIARKIADHLGLFDEVLATQGAVNLTGRAKLAALTHRFGEKGFDYAGNEQADLVIWKHARNAMVVGASDSLVKQVQRQGEVEAVIDRRINELRHVLKALRPYQWVKNLLLFVPLLTSHQFNDGRLVAMSVVGFAAFSLCASSVYILNDLLDVESDRRHASKWKRPFASGDLSLWWGLVLWPVLLASSFAIAWVLPPMFLWFLVLYFLGSTAYSFWLKKRAIVDVLVLTGLYTIRIYAGAEAIEVTLSPWLLAFSGFTFLSLAFTKRCSELLLLRQSGRHSAHGRGYSVGDVQLILSVGPASGYMACLVLALYISSPDVAKLYSRPGLLWLLCPVILYWFSHIWLLCSRNMMPEDPIVFAARDRMSYIVAVVAGFIMLGAT